MEIENNYRGPLDLTSCPANHKLEDCSQEQEPNSMEDKKKKRKKNQRRQLPPRVGNKGGLQLHKSEGTEERRSISEMNPAFPRSEHAGINFISRNVERNLRKHDIKAMVCQMKQTAFVNDSLSLPLTGDHVAETELLLKEMDGSKSPTKREGKESNKSTKKKFSNNFLKRHFLSLSWNDKLIIKAQLSIWFPCIFKRPSLSDIQEALSQIGQRVFHHVGGMKLIQLNPQLSESKAQRALFRKELSCPTVAEFKSNVVPECQKRVSSFPSNDESKIASKVDGYKCLKREGGGDSSLNKPKSDKPSSDFIHGDRNWRHAPTKEQGEEKLSISRETSDSPSRNGEEKLQKGFESKPYSIPNWFYEMLAQKWVLNLEPVGLVFDPMEMKSVEIDHLKKKSRRLILHLLPGSDSDSVNGHLHLCIKEQAKIEDPIDQRLVSLDMNKDSSSCFSKTVQNDPEIPISDKAVLSNIATQQGVTHEAEYNRDDPVSVFQSQSLESLPSLSLFPLERALSFRHVWKFTGDRSNIPRKGYIKSPLRNRIKEIQQWRKQNNKFGDTRPIIEWREGTLFERPKKAGDTSKRTGRQIWPVLFTRQNSNEHVGNQEIAAKDSEKQKSDEDTLPESYLSRQVLATKTRLMSVMDVLRKLRRSDSNSTAPVPITNTETKSAVDKNIERTFEAELPKDKKSKNVKEKEHTCNKLQNTSNSNMGKASKPTEKSGKSKRKIKFAGIKNSLRKHSTAVSSSDDNNLLITTENTSPKSEDLSEKSEKKPTLHKKKGSHNGRKRRVRDTASRNNLIPTVETDEEFKSLPFGEASYFDNDMSTSLNKSNSALHSSDENPHNIGAAPIDDIGKYQEVCMGITNNVQMEKPHLAVLPKEGIRTKELESNEHGLGSTAKEKESSSNHLFSELVSQYRNKYGVKEKDICTSPLYGPDKSFGDHGEPQPTALAYTQDKHEARNATTGTAYKNMDICEGTNCDFIASSSPPILDNKAYGEISKIKDEPIRRSLKAFIKKQWRSDSEPLDSITTTPRPLPRSISSALDQCPYTKQMSPRSRGQQTSDGDRKNKPLNVHPKIKSPGLKKNQDPLSLHLCKEPTYELMCAQRRANYQDLCAKIDEHYEVMNADEKPVECKLTVEKANRQFLIGSEAPSDHQCRFTGTVPQTASEHTCATEKSPLSCYDGTSNHRKHSPCESATRSLFSIPECSSSGIQPGESGNKSQVNDPLNSTQDKHVRLSALRSPQLDKLSMNEIERLLAGSSSFTSTESSKVDTPHSVFSALEKVLTRCFPEEYKNICGSEPLKDQTKINQPLPNLLPDEAFHSEFKLTNSVSDIVKTPEQRLSATAGFPHVDSGSKPLLVDACNKEEKKEHDDIDTILNSYEQNLKMIDAKNKECQSDTKKYATAKSSDCCKNDNKGHYQNTINQAYINKVLSPVPLFTNQLPVCDISCAQMSEQESAKKSETLQTNSIKEMQTTFHNKQKKKSSKRAEVSREMGTSDELSQCDKKRKEDKEDIDFHKMQSSSQDFSFNHGELVSQSLSQQANINRKTQTEANEIAISHDSTENYSPNRRNSDEETRLPSRFSFDCQTSRVFQTPQDNTHIPLDSQRIAQGHGQDSTSFQAHLTSNHSPLDNKNYTQSPRQSSPTSFQTRRTSANTPLDTQNYAKNPRQDVTKSLSDRPLTYLQTSPRFSKTCHPMKQSFATQISPRRTGSCAMQTSPRLFSCRKPKPHCSPCATSCARHVQTSPRFACNKSNTSEQLEAWSTLSPTTSRARPCCQRPSSACQSARSPSPNRLQNCHYSYCNFLGQSHDQSPRQQTRVETHYKPLVCSACEADKTQSGMQKCCCCDFCLKRLPNKPPCYSNPCEANACYQEVPCEKKPVYCCAQRPLQSNLMEEHHRLFSPTVHPCPYQSAFMQAAYSCGKCLIPEKREDIQHRDKTSHLYLSNKDYSVMDNKSTCNTSVLTETQKEALAYIASVLNCGKAGPHKVDHCRQAFTEDYCTEPSTPSLKLHKSLEADNRLLDPTKNFKDTDLLLHSVKQRKKTPRHISSSFLGEELGGSKCRQASKSFSKEKILTPQQLCKSAAQMKCLQADVKPTRRTCTDKPCDFFISTERPCPKQRADAGIQTCACISKRKGECKCGTLSHLSKYHSKECHRISSSCTDTRSGPSVKDDWAQTAGAFTLERAKRCQPTSVKKEKKLIYAKCSNTETETTSDSTLMVNKKCQIGKQQKSQNVSTNTGTSLSGSCVKRNTKGQQTKAFTGKCSAPSSHKDRQPFETSRCNCKATAMISDDSAILTTSCSEEIVSNSSRNICAPRFKPLTDCFSVPSQGSPEKECPKKKNIYSCSGQSQMWCDDNLREVCGGNKDLKTIAVVRKFDKDICDEKDTQNENRPIVHISYKSKQTGGKPKCCAVPPSTKSKDLNEQLKRQISDIIKQTKALQQHAQQLKCKCAAAKDGKTSQETAQCSQGSFVEELSACKEEDQINETCGCKNKNCNANPRNLEADGTNNVQQLRKHKRNTTLQRQLLRPVSAHHRLTPDRRVAMNENQPKAVCHENNDAVEGSLGRKITKRHKLVDGGQSWNGGSFVLKEAWLDEVSWSHNYTCPQSQRNFVNDPSEEAYQYINANLPQISRSFMFRSGEDKMVRRDKNFNLGQRFDERNISKNHRQNNTILSSGNDNQCTRDQPISSNCHSEMLTEVAVSPASRQGNTVQNKPFVRDGKLVSSTSNIPNHQRNYGTLFNLKNKVTKDHQEIDNAKSNDRTHFQYHENTLGKNSFETGKTLTVFAGQRFRPGNVTLEESSFSSTSSSVRSCGETNTVVMPPHTTASLDTSESTTKENISLNVKSSDGSFPTESTSSGLWKSSSYASGALRSHNGESSVLSSAFIHASRIGKSASTQQNRISVADAKRAMQGNTIKSVKTGNVQSGVVCVSRSILDKATDRERPMEMPRMNDAASQADSKVLESAKTFGSPTDKRLVLPCTQANKDEDSEASSHGIDDIPLDPVSNADEHKVLQQDLTKAHDAITKAPVPRQKCNSSISSHDRILQARPWLLTAHSDINKKTTSPVKTTSSSTQTNKGFVSQGDTTQPMRKPSSIISQNYTITPRKQFIKSLPLNFAKSEKEERKVDTGVEESFATETRPAKAAQTDVPFISKSRVTPGHKNEIFENPLVKWWNSRECLKERDFLNTMLRNRENKDSISLSVANSAPDNSQTMTNGQVGSGILDLHETPYVRKRRISRIHPHLFETRETRVLVDDSVSGEKSKEINAVRTSYLENFRSPLPVLSAEYKRRSEQKDDSPGAQIQLKAITPLPENIFLPSKPLNDKSSGDLHWQQKFKQWYTCLLSCAEVTVANDNKVVIEGAYTGNNLSPEFSQIHSSCIQKLQHTSSRAGDVYEERQRRSNKDHVVHFKLVLLKNGYAETRVRIIGTYFRRLLTGVEEFRWKVNVT